MTTTERSAAIRAELKRKGWSSRQVSVRSEQYAGGSSINVQINDPSIPLPIVKKIAEAHESIHRCEYSGEILSGANRYVSVRYSRDAEKIHGRRFADAVQRAVNQFPAGGSSSLFPVEGTPFLIGLPTQYGGTRLTIWKDGYISDAYNVDQAAELIGARMVYMEADDSPAERNPA